MQPLIVIGAPRSGTNMLRDILTSFDGVATWPCDEINYIWRHGNLSFPSDEIPSEFASSSVKRFIRKSFNDIRKKYISDFVVEKTCANSLRVDFVDAVFPEAKYIFIYRDGIDATGSAKERWTAKLDIPYILKKVTYVPKMDLPYYAFRYLCSRVYRFFSREKRLAFWGPTLEDMSTILHNYTLNEVCALQWQRCIEKAEEVFSSMPEGKVLRVRYEDFVCQPIQELTKILDFMGKEASTEDISMSVKGVSPLSLGKGRKALGDIEVAKLERLIGDTLKRYDYL